MVQLTCPPAEQITQFVLGKLDEDQAQHVSEHLAECPHCQAVAEQCDSASDPLIDLLRSPKPESPYMAEPNCQQSLNRLTDIRRRFPDLFEPGMEERNTGKGLDLPQVIGNYLLLKWLGGDPGSVYKAFHLARNLTLALRILPAEWLPDAAAVERFRDKIQAISRLDHPNVARVYDVREIAGRRFLMMEYVPGLDLDELVAQRGGRPVDEACQLVRQAALGLQCLCENGLVHRDIRPANLKLSADGRVRLLDLGLVPLPVRQRASGGDSNGLGLGAATEDYVAPEQIQDRHNADIRADIYGLGCTLYKLLAGRAPFETPDCTRAFDKLNAHLHRLPTPIQQLRDDVPDGLASDLERMLAKDPAGRFESPEQVAAVLSKYAAGADLRALAADVISPQEVAIRTVPTRSPNRWFWELVGVAVTIALLVLGGRLAMDWLERDTAVVAVVPGTSYADPVPWEELEPHGHQPAGTGRDRVPESPTAEQIGSHGERGEELTTPTGGIDDTPPLGDKASSPSAPRDVASSALPEPGPAEPESPEPLVQVTLGHSDGVDRGQPAGLEGRGQPSQVTITSQRPGYLYLLAQDADGTMWCLFPNDHEDDNRIEPGRPVTVLGSEKGFELQPGPPYGTRVLLALVSSQPLRPTRFGVASLTDRQRFGPGAAGQRLTIVDGSAVERLRAGLKQNPETGAEARVEITTRAGDGAEPGAVGVGEVEEANG